jgi:hypothetical protein
MTVDRDETTDGYMPLGDWRLWEQFAVRGAGFPASGVLRLAPDGLAPAADQFPPGTLTGPAWEIFEKQFEVAAVDTAVELQQVAALPAFRTAVAWQNPALLSRAIDNFAGWTPTAAGRTSKRREREELISHYWQRFCVKNDTIGFFGPVGWGRWQPSAAGVAIEPGTGLIERSRIYFASWAIDAVARTIERDPRYREWIAPRRVPFVRVIGDAVGIPGRPAERLSPELIRLLGLCSGRRSARDIQQEMGTDVDVPAALATLLGRRWIVWRLDIPAGAYPERYLRDWLAGVGDTALREQGLTLLDALERGRDRVAEASSSELPAAVAALENEFAELTAEEAARTKGTNTAPCRGLVYSDSMRSSRVRLGSAVLAGLAPVELLLISATWLTEQLAAQVLESARQIFTGLASRTDTVDLATFWFACMPILHGEARTAADRLAAELITRWSAVLDIPAGARQVRRGRAELEASIRAAFGHPSPGWTMARYLSPDVFLVAEDEAALRHGDVDLVLGELHVASNTLGASLYVHQHPNPAELLALTGRDHPVPRLLPVLAKEHKARLSTRIRHCLVRPEDYYVALIDQTGDPHRPRSVLSADVLVEQRDGELVAVLPDQTVLPVIDAFGHVLTTLVMDSFRILPEAAEHSPRVTVDRMILARETWRFTPDQLPFATETNEARRYVTARHWREQHQLPRHIFLTSATEPRPCYIDFDAPTYINILAKAARRLARHNPTAHLTITEMLPAPDQTWLTDDQHNRYTAELRFVAVHAPRQGGRAR